MISYKTDIMRTCELVATNSIQRGCENPFAPCKQEECKACLCISSRTLHRSNRSLHTDTSPFTLFFRHIQRAVC